jgi:hypothetical protein
MGLIIDPAKAKGRESMIAVPASPPAYNSRIQTARYTILDALFPVQIIKAFNWQH